MYSDMGTLTREEGLSYAVCMEELWTLSCCLWFWMHLWWLWHTVWLPVFWWRDFSAVRATLECCGDYSITQPTEGKTKVWIINRNTIKEISPDRGENQSMNNQQKYHKEISPDRGENQREKSKVSPLLVSPYYTRPNYNQGHYLVCTDPALCRPLTNPGCTYTSCFTSAVTPEVKVDGAPTWGQSGVWKWEQSGVLTQKAGQSGVPNSWSVRWGIPWQVCLTHVNSQSCLLLPTRQVSGDSPLLPIFPLFSPFSLSSLLLFCFPVPTSISISSSVSTSTCSHSTPSSMSLWVQ